MRPGRRIHIDNNALCFFDSLARENIPDKLNVGGNERSKKGKISGTT